MKTMTACKSRYANNNDNILPTNRRAKEVKMEYLRKFKKLDESSTGKPQNGTPGVFSQVQTRFVSNGNFPL